MLNLKYNDSCTRLHLRVSMSGICIYISKSTKLFRFRVDPVPNILRSNKYHRKSKNVLRYKRFLDDFIPNVYPISYSDNNLDEVVFKNSSSKQIYYELSWALTSKRNAKLRKNQSWKSNKKYSKQWMKSIIV